MTIDQTQHREMSRGLYYVWRYSDNFAADRRLCWHCYIGVLRQFLQPPQMHHKYETGGKHELVVGCYRLVTSSPVGEGEVL